MIVESRIKTMSVSTKIFIGMLLGIIVGLIVGKPMENVAFIGTMWMNLLKIAIAPMVMVMLIISIGRQEDPRRMGLISVQLIFYYILTTFLAGVLAILVAEFTDAGNGFQIIESATKMSAVNMTFSKYFVSMIPDNFFAPLVNSSLMQVLILGILCGIVVVHLKDKQLRESVLHGCECIESVLNGILKIALEVAPIGIFCYMGSIAGTNGQDVIFSLGKFLGTMIFADALQIVIVYSLIVVFLLQRRNPFAFLKNMLPSWVIAFTTSSSVLVIPSNKAICEEKYGCDPMVADFGIPLGAVFNFDGAAIFFPCVIIFAAQAAGINYSFLTLLYMSLIGTLIASSGGGVFGGALVKLLVMCELFSVPNSIITMIAGVFAIIDMFITVVNITGDVAGTTLVDMLEKRRKAKAKRIEHQGESVGER